MYRPFEVGFGGIVVCIFLLDGMVCQMNVRIRQVLLVKRERRVCEARKAFTVKIHLERRVRQHERVDAQVKLLAPHQVRVVDVLLRHVRRRPPGLLPLALLHGDALLQPRVNLGRLRYQENAFALTARHGLHDPNSSLFLERAQHHGALRGESERDGLELVRLHVRLVALLLRLLQGALYVLRHEVLASELHMVGEVVDSLVVRKPESRARGLRVCDVLVDPADICIEKVPVFVGLHFLPAAPLHNIVWDGVAPGWRDAKFDGSFDRSRLPPACLAPLLHVQTLAENLNRNKD
mmetsp:Transcript_22566/g.43058  ORF Transcript_22566/g.43058 Transcript_22566/m.43058 type:complete len:293 (+) Transcript_22566:611-1489(+)